MAQQDVQIIEQKFGYFPAKFRLKSRIIKIDAVEQCWTEMGDNRTRPRFHFRVRCGSDCYRLSQDPAAGRWSIRPEVDSAGPRSPSD